MQYRNIHTPTFTCPVSRAFRQWCTQKVYAIIHDQIGIQRLHHPQGRTDTPECSTQDTVGWQDNEIVPSIPCNNSPRPLDDERRIAAENFITRNHPHTLVTVTCRSRTSAAGGRAPSPRGFIRWTCELYNLMTLENQDYVIGKAL